MAFAHLDVDSDFRQEEERGGVAAPYVPGFFGLCLVAPGHPSKLQNLAEQVLLAERVATLTKLSFPY